MRLPSKVALVTGGARGIGRAITRLFAQEGAAVAFCDIKDELAKQTEAEIESAGGQVRCYHADVCSTPEVELFVESAVRDFGRVDILVNNAGAAWGDATILKTPEKVWDEVLDLCLKAVYRCSKAVLPHMLAAGGGSIVNISSVNALMGLQLTAYSAAKAGILSLTKVMAVEYGEHNVRVNAICPGTIQTELFHDVYAKQPEVAEQVRQLYPLKRLGEPGDVAYCALYLASDEAKFATGAIFVVDGGLSAGFKFPLEEIEEKP